jgi:hypothetical protein
MQTTRLLARHSLIPLAWRWGVLSRGFSSNKDLIEEELRKKLDLTYFAISDESAKHHEAHDSHFSIYVVSDSFTELLPIKR